MFETVSLITGGTGFVGQKLVKYLDHSGIGIRLISRKAHSHYESVICDLKDAHVPDSAMHGVDTVFHLAGFAHDLSNAGQVRQLYKRVNVDSTVRLAELSVHHGVKRFIYVSSIKAGGPAIPGLCMTEEDQGEPEGIYGKTKREAEIKLLEICSQSSMHVSIVRPSLVYGPGVKGNLRMMLSGIEKGWFPPLPEVENRRSLIHVDDLVQALLLTANESRANGEIFIATDGLPHSSREIYVAMCNVLGKSVPRWRLPKFLFDKVSFLSPRFRYKSDKLFGDECYSSKKLEDLGFRAERGLKDWVNY